MDRTPAIVLAFSLSVLATIGVRYVDDVVDFFVSDYDYNLDEISRNEQFCPAPQLNNVFMPTSLLSNVFMDAQDYAYPEFWEVPEIEQTFELQYSRELYRREGGFIGGEAVENFVNAIPFEILDDPSRQFIISGHAKPDFAKLYGSFNPMTSDDEHVRLYQRNYRNNLQIASDRANFMKKLLMARGVLESRIWVVNNGIKFERQAVDIRICGGGNQHANEHVQETSPEI